MKQIAILGPGTVGGGVAEILMKNADTVAASAGEEIGLKYAVARREMPDCPCAEKIVQDFSVIERDPEVWLVVETIGGCGAALDMVRRSLQAGKHVVTANKQLIAEHGVELFQLARENRVNLLFEASVGGGIPVLNPMTRCLGANHITSVSGILNGTTNYILTQMLENGESYDAALRAAQEKGYAEADPTADVEGIDAARKTCILAGLAFGKNVDPADIHVEGITKVTAADAAFAAAGGMKIKLLGRAMRQDEKLYCFVSPHFVPAGKILAAAGGVGNAVAVVGDMVGEVTFCGPGAGRYPTASAVVADIIDIARHPGREQPAGWAAADEKPVCYHDFSARWYVRTKEAKADVEAKLGAVAWLPEQGDWHGDVTGVLPRRALKDSGLALSASWPILD